MRDIFSKVVKLILSLGLGFFVVYISVRKLTEAQINEILEALKFTRYKWLLILILFGLISNYFRTKRWILISGIEENKRNFIFSFASVLLMFFGNLLFPRFGEASRCYVLSKYLGIPLNKSIASIIFERIIDLICILVLGLFIFIFERNRLNIIFHELFRFISNFLSSFFKTPVLLPILFSILVLIFLFKRKLSFLFKTKIQQTLDYIIAIKDIKKKPHFIFHTFGMWLCYILMPFFGFKALVATSTLGISPSGSCVFFGGFAMVITQGGIGAFPLTIQKVLALYNIDIVSGLAYGWLSWIAQTIAVIIGGIISLIIIFKKHATQ